MRRVKIWNNNGKDAGFVEVPDGIPQHVIFCNRLFVYNKQWNVYVEDGNVFRAHVISYEGL